jgi:NAD(P)-dependent dehydrogenase (short-subunit alcohol dehydrogenase family)
MQADLSQIREARRVAAVLPAEKLDMMIFTAGIFAAPQRQQTEEGIERGRSSIVFIGATASRRGGVNTAAFAPAKAAQRSFAESMARKLWPKGIHVALVIIDGIVDTPYACKFVPDKPADALVPPATLAETTYWLTVQDHRGWSFEVEARTLLEIW